MINYLKSLLKEVYDFLERFIMFISSSKRNSLRKAYKDRFLIGSAIGPGLNRKHVRILRRHFNSITPEDCMKMIWVQQKQGVYNFAKADEFVRFGKRNGMTIIGHSLVWGLKNPEIFFTDNVGNLISKEELTERMRNYIHLVVNRYKKYIKCWDVVNEVLKDNGEFINNRFFEILGEDYVKLAFRFAREADPDAILYFNELKLSMPEKRAGAVRMIKKLQADGVRVDGVGIQTHCNMSFPDINEVEKTIVAFSELGCRISITEMDMSVLPVFNPFIDPKVAISKEYQQSLNPFADKLPDKIMRMQAERYKSLFALFIKYQDKIDRVTLWGITDDMSSKNDFPIPGRTDYPLLFDRKYRAKPVVKELIGMGHS